MRKKNSEVRQNIFEEFDSSDIINSLIFLGRIESEINIGDINFRMRTLSEREQKELVAKIFKLPDNRKLAEIKSLTLAMAISDINNHKTKDIAIEMLNKEGAEITEELINDKKYELVLNLQSNIIVRLFEEYERLNKESIEAVGIEEVKK